MQQLKAMKSELAEYSAWDTFARSITWQLDQHDTCHSSNISMAGLMLLLLIIASDTFQLAFEYMYLQWRSQDRQVPQQPVLGQYLSRL